MESRVDIFEKYNARGAMEIFYIGTDPEYQARGIGRQITDKSLEVARGLRARKLKQICVGDKIVNEHVRPEVAFAVAASIYSQRIMEILDFDTLAEVRYEDYIRGGKKMSDRIGDLHRTVKFVARKPWRLSRISAWILSKRSNLPLCQNWIDFKNLLWMGKQYL